MLALALVFLCGAVSGMVAARFVLPQVIAAKAASAWKDGGKEMAIDRFKKELDLTPQQAEEIETVLDDYVMYYQMLQSQMDEVRATGKNRILQVLSPQQRVKFDRMLSELQAKQLK